MVQLLNFLTNQNNEIYVDNPIRGCIPLTQNGTASWGLLFFYIYLSIYCYCIIFKKNCIKYQLWRNFDSYSKVLSYLPPLIHKSNITLFLIWWSKPIKIGASANCDFLEKGIVTLCYAIFFYQIYCVFVYILKIYSFIWVSLFF